MTLEELVVDTANDRARLEGVQRWYDPKVWSTDLARIQLPKSGYLDFVTRPFLVDPFRDTAPEIVFLKGAQLGFSTLAICRTLWAATTFPMSIIYTFPTRDDVTEFTAARINPIVLSSEYLSSRILDVNSVKMKQFALMNREQYRKLSRGGVRMDETVRLSTVYFNGAAKPEDATTVDADLLIHDEEDRSNPQVIEQYESRLDASAYKWKIRLSTPTIPGAGIDRAWRLSDQRSWMVKCPGCNAEFELDFPVNIEPETYEEIEDLGRPARFKCHACSRTLSDGERSHGRWVASRPAQGRPHGYHLSQMSAPWISAERILYRKMKATWEADFWNLVMGRPWEGGSNVMTAEAIKARCTGGPMAAAGSGCTMGVDVGRKLDVVIGAPGLPPRTIYVGRLDDFDELDQLMGRFGVVCCVIDAMPETRKVKEFVERFPGRVWRANYSDPTRGMPRETKWDEDSRVVTVGRTDALDASSTELLSTRILPNFDGSEAMTAYVEHHVNSKRVPIFVPGMELERIVQQYRWVEIGPDHLFHAGTYEWMARQGFAPSAAIPSRSIYGLNRSVKWGKQVREGYDPRRLDRRG